MKPLEGIKVVELASMLAGPMCGRVLAEWGAEIIKVETFNGDAWRKQGGTTLSPTTEVANPNFDMQNLNKRFVSLNFRNPEALKVMYRLLEGADVLLTNFREQALTGMGLSYEQLKTRFPRLIHAGVLGYGAEGPDKDRPGYDYTAFFSRSGLMADLSPAGAGPLVPIGGVGDHSVAMALAGGIAAALYRRSVTGEGDKVDVSLLQTGIFICSTGILNGVNGRVLPRSRYDCGHAGSNTYQGSDGEWFYLACIDFRRFPELCELIGRPDIAVDPKYSTPLFGAGVEYAYNSIVGPIRADLHWSNITRSVGFYLSLILGVFSGLKLASLLDDAGVFAYFFGTSMKKLAAFCVTIFLVMLVYALFWLFSRELSRKAKITIGVILWILALLSFLTMPQL